MAERAQNYANHTNWNPLYHFFAFPLTVVFLVWALRRALDGAGDDAWLIAFGAFALVAVAGASRMMALRVQDRLIRHEERMRLMRVLPADLQPHIRDIRTSHLIALRFASDEELPELVRWVLANPAVTPKEIKQKVRNWQADWLRT